MFNTFTYYCWGERPGGWHFLHPYLKCSCISKGVFLLFSLLFKESKVAYSYICVEAWFSGRKAVCYYWKQFSSIHLCFARHNLKVLKASVLREKLSCKEAFNVLWGMCFFPMLCFSTGEDQVSDLLCTWFRISFVSWTTTYVFFLCAVFIYTEVKYLLISQKYFHVILTKLKCGGGKLCFFWFCVRRRNI